MGLQITSDSDNRHRRTFKMFLFCNYALLGAASSCAFLTLSLRLLPSLCGFFLILLHGATIAAAVASSTTYTPNASSWYGAHMAAAVLTAIFQGSVAILVFTRTLDFLSALKSYVRDDDGAVILRLAGGLCVVIFVLEWVGLTLAFAMRYYASVEGEIVLGRGGHSGNVRRSTAKVGHQDEDVKDWPWPFQV